MKILSITKVKEVQIQVDEQLDLDRWDTASDLQISLKCGEILEVKISRLLLGRYYGL